MLGKQQGGSRPGGKAKPPGGGWPTKKWFFFFFFPPPLPAIPGVLHFQCVVQKNKVRPASATHAAYLPIHTKPCGPVKRTHAPGLDGGHAPDKRLTPRPLPPP